MKKVFAALLAATLLLGLAACGGTSNSGSGSSSKGNASGNQSTQTTPSASTPVDPKPVELEGMQRIIVLNNAFDGLALSKQCYNAKEYHKAYNLGEIIDDNFWIAPAEDTVVQTVAYTDFYADECDLATFRGKYISFQADNPEYDYDLFVGPNQKESSDVQYKGYCVVDHEVILLMQEEGWNVQELFEYVAMKDADAYDFICADGYTATIQKADLADTKICYVDSRVDSTVPGKSYTLQDIRYIVPTGWTKDSVPANVEGVCKINVGLNALGVYKTEAPYTENRAGTFYDAYSVAELLAKHDVAQSDKVKVISYKDGYSQDEDYALFSQKYIAYQGPNEKGDNKDYFTLGKVQERNAGVTNAGYYILSEDAFAFIPADGISVSDIFEATGMAQTDKYELTYADGKTETKTAAEVTGLKLAQGDTLLYITAVAG